MNRAPRIWRCWKRWPGVNICEIAYAEALRERYLWHEFGDLHLILP